jgi:hypothetical protein
MSGKSAKNFSVSGAGRFATTHWSVVLQAGQPKAPGYQQALETLCESYWFPLYAYLRRHGYDIQQAEDSTQAFFCRILEKQVLRMADEKRGKFRSLRKRKTNMPLNRPMSCRRRSSLTNHGR